MDYTIAAKKLHARVIETGNLRISEIDLGRVGRDTNLFSARVSSTGARPIELGVSLRTVPGLWFTANWQRGYRYQIPPGSSTRIEARYVFRRMSPEATLRVMLGSPSGPDNAITIPEPVFDTTLQLGAGNPAAFDPRPLFDTMSSAHLDVLAWRGSAAARQLGEIVRKREAALDKIAALLGVEFPGRIRLVFYPDSASKTSQTGHIGAGFAGNRNIVEIFNDSVQLDPYHELTHIVAGNVGSPPAFLDEGFAVYVTELLGEDALKYLGSPGKSLDQTTCQIRRSGQWFGLGKLIRFTDIGSDSTYPSISYPAAGSLVSFLIRHYGIERFRSAYGRLKNPRDEVTAARNQATLEELYGVSSAELERAWLEQVCRQP